MLHGEPDKLRDRFATEHCVVLENLLERPLLEKIQREIERAQWNIAAFDDFGTELTLHDSTAVNLLKFLLNGPEFLRLVRVITGCAQISDLTCRVYRLCAGSRHQLSWHTDASDPQRQVGFSLNLSTDVFHGGAFELRDRHTSGHLARVNNTGFGDALLFRISRDLQHRVAEVEGTVAKTACAGWFRATGKTFFAELVDDLNGVQGSG